MLEEQGLQRDTARRATTLAWDQSQFNGIQDLLYTLEIASHSLEILH